MRIVILSYYSGQVERGVEVYVNQLKKHLSAHFQVEVIVSADIPLKVKPYKGDENVLLRRLYLDKTSLCIKKATRTVLADLAKNPPDILYPVNNGWQSILAKKFCKKWGSKLILAGHSGPGWDDRVNLWLKPDAFIAFSRSQAEWARGVRKNAPIDIIPHAVDLNQFKQVKSPIKLLLEKPVFISVASLKQGGGETNKNIEATIDAVAKLKQGSLILIGDGNDAPRIDKLASSKLHATRYMRVSVSHNIINKYYQAADVFTLASSASEAFGISYLEALACNLPVVTADDQLRHEIIGPAGVFIKNPNDANEYSRGLQQAIKTNWGNIPRQQSLKYSWDSTINKYNELLETLNAKR